MSDDLKKTVLQPKFANRMAYKTIVMGRPPEMFAEVSRSQMQRAITSEQRKRPQVVLPSRFQSPAVTKAKPQAPAMPTHEGSTPGSPTATCASEAKNPVGISSMDVLRTRMVDAHAMPTFHKHAPSSQRLCAAPNRPPRVVSDASVCHKDRARKAVVLGCFAILLGVSLVLLLSGTAGDSETASQAGAVASSLPATTSDPMFASEPLAKGDDEQKRVSTNEGRAMVATDATEEEAAAMLLAGRQREALSLYLELANSSKATPGIHAMAEVLAQKVAAQ